MSTPFGPPTAVSATLAASATDHHPDPAVRNAMRTLSTWIALESLGPQTYRNPSDLTTETSHLDKLDPNELPWKNDSGVERNEAGDLTRRVYHQVVLGSIALDPASQAIMEAFGSDEERGFPNSSRVPIASIMLATDGSVIEKDGIAISSFAWAFPKATARKFADLYKWDEAEKRLQEKLTEILAERADILNPVPLSMDDILRAYRWLVEDLGIPEEMVGPPEFSIRTHKPLSDEDLPEPLLANSLFIKDLGRARASLFNNKAGLALRRYMGVTPPEILSSDITEDHAALASILQASKMPAGRWPSPGGHPLVLMQQAAVNEAMETGRTGGIMGVQGPPGTGKTTLLRDIVAANIVARASAMAALKSPAMGISRDFVKFNSPDGDCRVHELDESLMGFEMVVASSNNKAVENVTLELPQSRAVGRRDAVHFRSISDALANPPTGKGSRSIREYPLQIPQTTWGLVAAALGNMRNRRRFRNIFWDHRDFGFGAYLKAVKGNPDVEVKDEDSKPMGYRPSAVSLAEKPPTGRNAPFENWNIAVRKFRMLETAVAELMAARPTGNATVGPVPDLEGAQAALDECMARRPRGLPNLKSPGWLAWKADETRLKAELAEMQQIASDIPGVIVDAAFLSGDHEAVQTAAPWLSPKVHAAREDLFLAALDLHKAFFDYNADLIDDNLKCMMTALVHGLSDNEYIRGFWKHMWSTLSLVVPVVSTTFASVNAMFSSAPKGEASIAWLLVDEAGQATPQAAVGAIMRARNVIVVGDPLQIPPVVTLPSKLVDSIAEFFSVEPAEWTAPTASAQVLADRASRINAQIGDEYTGRSVGLPLLVHRRCLDPMFTISNEVAYDGAMVYRTAEGDSGDIAGVLGDSRWLDVDVANDAKSKWSEAEGRQLVAMLQSLAAAGITEPDIFVVSPFRDVARGARKILRAHGEMLERLGIDPDKWLQDRVGTVHTVQGREAEAVFLLLGAAGDSQAGARNWAGETPNILNVAVSRARKRLYVIGNASAWSGAGAFRALAEGMPVTDCEI